ncbi:iron-containing alcohol dehydrogenase [Anaerovorax sp. IOR16]|uniref:iron-containing alcohol dehydrogenase n=1 Tax=Anaerovorax sp. IOR16 TaxID=2773458 RepID=UPI0019D0775F|nr:iron-containing alcohol dehydrogenase [Anaerovorax sp. IOR16]
MRFTIPRDIYYGRGSISSLGELVSQKAVIVTGGKSMQKYGFLQKAKNILEDKGTEVFVFEGVEPDPSIDTVNRGAAFMRENMPDLIVAMGGGSAIDAAKAMWIFYEYPEKTFDDIKEPFTLPPLRQKALFAAIPSTSGTATEVTAFSVITDEVTGIKYPLADFNLTPDVAILDVDLAEKMPQELIAHTGMDALTHAVEAYVATAATAFTDPLALHAIQLIFLNLLKSYEGDKEAKESMHNAQCLAGMAFSNALLGITHSMAHKTGHIFHIPHGLANAIYMPYVISYNAKNENARYKYAQIAKAIGIEEENEDILVNKLIELILDLGNAMHLPSTLKEYGISEAEFQEKVDAISENAAKDPCTFSNPRKTEKEDIKALFQCIYEGKAVKF